MNVQLSPEEQAFQDAAAPTGPPQFPVVSHFEVLLTAIFPGPPGNAGNAAAAAPRVDPRHLPSPFRQLAEARDDGRGRTAGILPAAPAPVPRPEVLQGLFILITNANPTPVSNLFVVLEVNTAADAQSLANDTLAFDLRTGAPVVGRWIARAGQTYAYYGLNTPLAPGETTNLACIPNFLKDPAPNVSVRGLLSMSTTAPALYVTPEQRAVFFPPDGGAVFRTVAYCLTTRTGTNLFQR